MTTHFHQWDFEALPCLAEQLAEFLFGFFSVEISFVFFAWKWERNNQPGSLVQSHASYQAVSAFCERREYEQRCSGIFKSQILEDGPHLVFQSRNIPRPQIAMTGHSYDYRNGSVLSELLWGDCHDSISE